MMQKPELLCPAGDEERLLAALCFGADAVYLGAVRDARRTEKLYDGRAAKSR